MTALAVPTLLCLIGVLLVALSIYDNREYILPDKLNLALGGTGLALNAAQDWVSISLTSCLLGAAIGGGFLWIIRCAANRYYNADAVGLGDVKLMIAAGLIVGFPDIMLVLTLGAGLGLLHGLGLGLARRKRGEPVNFARINVPAGVGLCGGIALVIALRFAERGGLL